MRLRFTARPAADPAELLAQQAPLKLPLRVMDSDRGEFDPHPGIGEARRTQEVVVQPRLAAASHAHG
jgi:hypothetical protein